MFKITNSSLDSEKLRKNLISETAGAIVEFEGRVRNKNKGKTVSFLEYEIYETLARKEGAIILAETKEKFDIENASSIHRYGKVKAGEVSIWIGVSSKHRKAAFAACEYIIDEIKKRVPVWKKEFYTSSEAEWVNPEQK